MSHVTTALIGFCVAMAIASIHIHSMKNTVVKQCVDIGIEAGRQFIEEQKAQVEQP